MQSMDSEPEAEQSQERDQSDAPSAWRHEQVREVVSWKTSAIAIVGVEFERVGATTWSGTSLCL